MPELSLAAKAIQDAATNAAVLRVLAEQIEMTKPFGGSDADYGVFAAHHAIRSQLIAMADELEAQ